MLSQTSRYVVPAHHFASGQSSLSVFQPYGDSLVATIKDDRLANDEAAGLFTTSCRMRWQKFSLVAEVDSSAFNQKSLHQYLFLNSINTSLWHEEQILRAQHLKHLLSQRNGYLSVVMVHGMTQFKTIMKIIRMWRSLADALRQWMNMEFIR
jgi:hypothetical protein